MTIKIITLFDKIVNAMIEKLNKKSELLRNMTFTYLIKKELIKIRDRDISWIKCTDFVMTLGYFRY
jgi:hypothetical protein